MSSSVTIGSRPDCDLVVNVPSVSGHHCRLTRDETGFVLEDLNSTNGTFVNGERIRGAVRVRLTATDTIHLGSHALSAERVLSLIDREPTPTISFRGAEMVIGRIPGCDHVIDLPMISSRHARLFREGDRILIEDLRSSNGTFVNGTRVEGPVVLNSGDEVGLGSHLVTLAADSWTQPDVVQPAVPSAPLSETPQSFVPSLTEIVTSSSTSSPATELDGILSRPWRLVALLAQAPLAALLIVGLVGTNSPAPILFWLGLAAIWFGLADAVLGNVIDPTRLRAGLSLDGAPALALRLLMLAVLCALQCLLAWVIVANMAALKAPGLPVFVLLVLASAVGLALGLLIVVLSPRAILALAILPVIVLLMWLFGGLWRPVHPMSPMAAAVSSFVPSRWAFEGLALLEADQRQVATSADGSDPVIDHDLAEDYFPARTDRMGVRADVMALGAMFLGLTAAVAFISASSKPGR
ncbi:MAG: FHA domain-containing protein [Isosphaeraceae bacterium]|jgi:pSer/pThr/pTyr-binding forkhead associated (FHA) protein